MSLWLVAFAEEQPKPLPTPALTPEIPPTTTDIVKEAEDNLRQAVARGLPQSAKVRPWDFGKEGVPKKPGNPFLDNAIFEQIVL